MKKYNIDLGKASSDFGLSQKIIHKLKGILYKLQTKYERSLEGMKGAQYEKRDLTKRLKDQEKAYDDFSKKILIDSESVMDEAGAMMKIVE